LGTQDIPGMSSFGVLGIGVLSLQQPRVALLECVGDVLEEDEAEGDVLVFGSVHVAAHLVGSGPKFLLKTEIGGGAVLRGGFLL